MKNPSSGFPTMSDTKRIEQPLKIARGMKFGLRKWRNCTFYVAKTKALISCAVTEQLICAFVFAYAKSSFSHDADQLVTQKVDRKSLQLLGN